MKINDISTAFPGSCELRMHLLSDKENINIEVTSTKYRVDPTNELLDRLAEVEGIACKLQ